MMDHYILKDRVPVPVSFEEWCEKFSEEDRRVALTNIGDVEVSTVFLGMDHSFGGGEPLLFETMVFGGPLDEEMDRCGTWEEAEEMHRKMCERVETHNEEAN
jgi:hypothetical protein